MHTLLACLSKFNTSLACKSIYTFFFATENEKCIKKKKKKNMHFSSKFPGTPKKNVNTLYIFHQQYRRKMYKLRKKYISTFFRSLYIFHCIRYTSRAFIILYIFCFFVVFYFIYFFFCIFSFPLGIGGGLRIVIVALPGGLI